MTTTTRQRPAGAVGRTRDAGRDLLILEAALDLLSESGSGAISIEAIAARAGVGKATVYRRWAGLGDLLADAVDTLGFDADIPASADTRTALVEGLISTTGCLDPRRRRIVSGVMSTEHSHPEVADGLRRRFLVAVGAALDVARGTELDALPAAERERLAASDIALVVGLLMSLPHVTREALSRRDFERIVDDVLLPLWATRRASSAGGAQPAERPPSTVQI